MTNQQFKQEYTQVLAEMRQVVKPEYLPIISEVEAHLDAMHDAVDGFKMPHMQVDSMAWGLFGTLKTYLQ